MESTQRIGVIHDPHPLWLEAVAPVLARAAVDVVGQTVSATGALELLREHQPHVFVTEIVSSPTELQGTALLERVREVAPATKTIVLSSRNEPETIDAALVAGAVAYVVKTSHADDVASAVRQAFDHSLYLARLGNGVPAAASPATGPGLTRREIEILRLVAEGRTNAQVARTLWVTEQTVKFHLSNVYRKLDVSNRTEAGHWAQVHGLLPSPTVPV
jgi:DNA-binding NarL/FixJ family response regulator